MTRQKEYKLFLGGNSIYRRFSLDDGAGFSLVWVVSCSHSVQSVVLCIPKILISFMPIRIRHKRPECIGCDLCAQVAPQYWYMDEEDGLATLLNVTETRGQFSYADAFDSDLPILEEAARSCPVDIIKVERG